MSSENYQQIGDILKAADLLKAKSNFVGSSIFEAWTISAGEKIAGHTSELKEERHLLYVTVDSGIWGHAVANHQETILLRMREQGHVNLKEMFVRVRPQKPKKTAPHVRPQAQARPKPISPSLRETFRQLAKCTNNPKIRSTFLRMSQIGSDQ